MMPELYKALAHHLNDEARRVAGTGTAEDEDVWTAYEDASRSLFDLYDTLVTSGGGVK